MRCTANRALHQPGAVALGGHALLVDLLHAEGHVEVAERVQRDHRNLELAVGLGNPAQPVGAQAVGIRRAGELQHRRVERRRARSVAGDRVGEAIGVERALVQDAVDRAVAAEHADHDREGAAIQEAEIGDGPVAARQVLDDALVFEPGGCRHQRVRRKAGEQDRNHLRGDIGPVDERVLRQVGQCLCGHLRAREVVEEFGVADHAAHRSGAVVLDLVVGGRKSLVFDGSGGNVAAHRHARDVDLAGFGQRAVVGRSDLGEVERQRVGVFDAGAHVVEVLAVARCSPGVAVLDQVAADLRVVDGQLVAFAAVAVRVHDQLAVPVGRHLDAIERAAQNTLPAAGRRVDAGGVGRVCDQCRKSGGGCIGGRGRERGAAVLHPFLFRGRSRRRCRRRSRGGCRRRCGGDCDRKAVVATATTAARGERQGCCGQQRNARFVHDVSEYLSCFALRRTERMAHSKAWDRCFP